MLLLVLFYFLLAFSCPDVKNQVHDRTNFAYQALLLYKGAPFCSGAIINDRHVVTAASCCRPKSNLIVKPSEVRIVVGNLDLYDFSDSKEVENVFIHEKFNTRTLANDIAVLRISGTFEITPEVQPITLRTDSLTSGKCNVSGWGTNYYNLKNDLNDELDYVEVPIVDREECCAMYVLTNTLIDENKICAGLEKEDSCQGDSGGPLVCDGELTGILSDSSGCAYQSVPSVYTEVSRYIEWIETQKIRTTSDSDKIISSSLFFVVSAIIILLVNNFIIVSS